MWIFNIFARVFRTKTPETKKGDNEIVDKKRKKVILNGNSSSYWDKDNNYVVKLPSESSSSPSPLPSTSTEKTEAEKQLELRKPHDLWNTVIFFPDYELEGDFGPTAELIMYLQLAHFQLQICMFKFSSWRIAKALMKLKIQNENQEGNGIDIQFITDADLNNKQLRDVVRSLKKHGIQIRLKKSLRHMHHKFVIVDQEAVMTGSLNWTIMGLTKNEEDVIVSTNPEHVSLYKKRFQTLWEECKEESQPTTSDVH